VEDLKFLKIYNPQCTGRLELLIKRKLGDMKCPYCGHKLEIPPVNVEVSPAKIKNTKVKEPKPLQIEACKVFLRKHGFTKEETHIILEAAR